VRAFLGFRPAGPPTELFPDPDRPAFEGVEFDDGTVAVRWLSSAASTSVWPDLATFLAVHGHSEFASRRLVFLDPAWELRESEEPGGGDAA
jgi:hypothetical protein